MTRARDIANLGSNPPLTKTLGTSLVSAGTVSSSSVVTGTPIPVTLWQPSNAVLGNVQTVGSTPAYTFKADFADMVYFNWSSHSWWSSFYNHAQAAGSVTVVRIDQGSGNVFDYDVVTSSLNYTSGNYDFTWEAWWFKAGTWTGSTGTLPVGAAYDPHPDGNMGNYTVTWLQPNQQDRVTSTDSNAATILGSQEKFLIGSTAYNVADVTLSGADITWPDSTPRSFTNGDTIGYYNSPDTVIGTLNDGTDVILEFDSTSSPDGFVIDGNPVQGLEVNYYSNPTNSGGATDAGINQEYGGGTVSVNNAGYNVQGYVIGSTYTLPRPNPSPKGKFLIQGMGHLALSNNTENWEMLEATVFLEILLPGHPKGGSNFMVPPTLNPGFNAVQAGCARFYARGAGRTVPRQNHVKNFFQFLITDAPAVDLQFRVRGLSSHTPASTSGTTNDHTFKLSDLRIIEL